MDKAMDHVFGFTVAHDVSARDWQLRKNGGQWLLGKAMNGFCPIGPSIVTPDEMYCQWCYQTRLQYQTIGVQNRGNCFMVLKVLYLITWRSDLNRYTPWSWMLQKSSRIS